MSITTPAQQKAIAAQASFYDTDQCPCDGLISHRVYDAGTGYPAGAVKVDFTYRYEDGSPGLETSVYDPQGECIDSQDFG